MYRSIAKYRPQGNIVERSHRTINAFLRAYSNKKKDDWDNFLKYAAFAYNNSVNVATNQIPHYLAHGFNIQILNHLTKQKLTYNYDNLADQTRNNIAEALQMAKENIQAQKIKNKHYYDKKINEQDFEVGDMILIKTPARSHTLDPIYEGPYEILGNHQNYIEYMKNNKRQKIHKNYIKKAKANYTAYTIELSN